MNVQKIRKYFNYFLLALILILYIASIVVFVTASFDFALVFFGFATLMSVVTYFLVNYQKNLTK